MSLRLVAQFILCVLILGMSETAWSFYLLQCDSQIPVYGLKNGKMQELTLDQSSFTIDPEQTSVLLVGLEATKPYAEIYPMAKFYVRRHDKNLTKELDLKVKTDEESFITLTITGRKKKRVSTLTCTLAMNPDATPQPTPTPKSSPRPAPSKKPQNKK